MVLQRYIKALLKKVYYRYNALLIHIQEKTFHNGVKYIYKDNGSDNLLVIFSGIGGDYNYRRSLKNSTWNQLYIKDSWADGLSYYLFEDGDNHPEILTSELIAALTPIGKYKRICALGSSKGGAAAIYFGLKHCFDEIFAGACQYKVGNYIGIFHEKDNYYPKLMGSIPKEDGIIILNDKFDKMLDHRAYSHIVINLIYSTNEHTYIDDILPLLHKLDECHIQHKDQIESFTEHSMVGRYMSEFCKKNFI